MASPSRPESYQWIPSPELVAQSNVGRFMERHGIGGYDQLVRQSSEDPEWFWHGINLALGLEWFKPYKRVMDDSAGPEWTKWFVGGLINVAHNCLDRHAKSARSERKALIWEGEDGCVRELTYGELAEQTNRLANALTGLGVRSGDRVALFLPMIPEVVVALLAVAKLGAVAVPMFSGFGSRAIADRLIDSGASTILTADGFLRKGRTVAMKDVVDEALVLCPSVASVVVFNRLGLNLSMHPRRDHDWADLLAEASPECATKPVDAEHPFLIAYTSGTTGKPKGSVHVHGGFLVKIAAEVAFQIDLRPEDVLYWFTDMGWIMGPWEVIGGLAQGATLFLYEGAPDHPSPDRIWSQIDRHQVSIFGTSPTLIRSLMRHGDEPVLAHQLSSLRILGSTGEPWNEGPWNWYFEKVGRGRCPIINFSGGTEVGACFLSASVATPLKACSLGRPALGMAVDVFDSAGQPLTEGVGELVCTKPWPGMTRGLWNAPDRYLETYWSRWPDTWVHGDWASVDEDGDWFLYGRSDDTLKVAGKRLGPSEVESVLVSHPDVAEAAAVGIPDDLKGESVWGVVVLREGVSAVPPHLEAELRELVATALGKSFAPERVITLPELPKTRSGKVVRRAIRATLMGEEPGDLSTLDNPSSLARLAAVKAP